MGHRRVNVLLFGATGAVGRSCLDILARGTEVSVVIAGRDEARLRDVASAVGASDTGKVEIARLDLTDVASVVAAVPGSDVVINCAGPSHRFSSLVADAAIAAGVPYVDPGGGQALLDRLTAAAPAVPVVLQAGVQPGLSGLLLCELVRRRPVTTGGITAWCGGLQRLTPASVLEYLASLGDPRSHPGAALRGGTIQRVGRADCKAAPPQYYSGSAMVRPHLDAETVAVAAHLGAEEVLWMNVFDGAHTTRAMQALVFDGAGPGDAGLAAVLSAARLDLFGRRPYFAIVCCIGATTVAISCPDSYRVTGALTAFAAEHIGQLPAGVRPLWGLDEPQRVLNFVSEVVPEVRITCADDAAQPMIEEGSL